MARRVRTPPPGRLHGGTAPWSCPQRTVGFSACFLLSPLPSAQERQEGWGHGLSLSHSSHTDPSSYRLASRLLLGASRPLCL